MKQYSLIYDIAVIGGGPAGLSAAITAARSGKRVLLAEKNGYLGGSLAIGLSPLSFLDKQGRKCVAGFGEEFMNRLEADGYCLGTAPCPKHNSATCVNAEGVKLTAAAMCREAGVDVLLHCEVLNTTLRNGRLESVTLFGKCNEILVTAKQFIDCTGDGDLAYLAGCDYEKGQDGTGVLQPPTVMFTLEGVDQEKLFRYVEEHPEELRYADRNIYENPDYTVAHFRKHPSHVFVGLQNTFRALAAQGKLPVKRESFIYINSTNPGEVYVNSIRLTDTDATDLLQLSNAELEGALQVPKLVKLLQDTIPGFERCFVSSICPSLGIRETRRFRGISRVTENDALTGAVPEDTIALSGYKIDVHSGTDTGLLFKDVNEPFGISFGCLVSPQVENLMFAGRCISADPVALGSLRIIPTCMALGQAAGVGASLCIDENTDPKDADVSEIRRILRLQNAILSMN